MITPDDILAGHSPAVIKIAQRLRGIVRRTVPEASERAYPAGAPSAIAIPERYFCAIFPQREHVALALEFGAYLPDPEGLLVSGPSRGQQVRYVEIRRIRDLRVRAIENLLRAAIALRSGGR